MSRIAFAVVSWAPLTVLLFRILGPRRAVLISVLGGYLFLPRDMFGLLAPWSLQVGKETSVGLGLIVAAVLFDRRTLRSARPHWLDLPMAVYVLYPVTGLISGGAVAHIDVMEMLLQRALGWFVPYTAARLYFGDGEGVRRVAAGVVMASLALAPFIGWEVVMGPRWFMRVLAFDLPFRVEERLGSWTPEGFLLSRLELMSWLATGAAVSVWLWLGRVWRPARGPACLPPLVLVALALSARGVFGYITLGLGLAAAFATQTLRTRWVLVGLVLVAPTYFVLRVSGALTERPLLAVAEVTHRSSTLVFRVKAEREMIATVLSHDPVLGFGTRLWNPKARQLTGHWPDGYWLTLLWEGGLAGLALNALALHLLPSGLALARPHGRPSRPEAGSASWGLVLFTALNLTDSIYNFSNIMPVALVAGALIGQSVTRKRGTESSGGRGPGREEVRGSGGPVEEGDRLIPREISVVAALACLLYVFGHGPVVGHDGLKFVGGLGAALLFAVAGWAGAWAAGRFPAGRVTVYGVLFASLGVSFNLFIHPASRPVLSADIFQGLALCGVAVACWRHKFGDNVWAESALAVGSLVVHFLLRPYLPVFPGTQYLFAGPAGGLSLFPVCPWLTVAVLGVRASREKALTNLATAAVFATAAAYFWWAGVGRGVPVKFPMDLSYATASCAAVGVAFALARVASGRGSVRRAMRWLGARWMIFFYVHFAVVFALERSGTRTPQVIWSLLGAGSVAGVWLVSMALSPLKPWFRRPAPWGVLLVAVLAAGWLPGLPPMVVAGASGFAGLLFAAHYGALASCVVNARTRSQGRFLREEGLGASPPRPRGGGFPDPAHAGSRWPGLIRLVVVLVVLASPEIITWVVSRFGAGPPASRHRPVGPERPGR